MSEEKIENVEEEINEKTEENGVQISDDVVAVIAGKAASEVSGVFSMAGGFAGGITEVFGKKNFSKGIKVEVQESKVKVDVNIIVEYGARIPDVAFEIQEKKVSGEEPLCQIIIMFLIEQLFLNMLVVISQKKKSS